MDTIFSYIELYGTKTFNEMALNEVDNLIFCALTYIHFDLLIQKEDKISLKQLYVQYQKVIDINHPFKEKQNRLFDLISKSKRFKDVLVTNYVNEVSIEEEKQFGAITYVLPKNQVFVAFKGTDETVIGWKEDFLMSYQVIPSQKSACAYLEDVLKNSNGEVFVGGHSKGGNLALYAAVFCKDEFKDKIKKVYNNDGPGFKDDIKNQENFQKIKDRLVTYIPKASLVGNLFDSYTKTIIILSHQIGILQHDLYSWVITNNHFIYVSEMDKQTKKLANTVNKIIDVIPVAQKKRIITFLYDLLTSLHIYNFEVTLENILKKYHLQFEDIMLLKKILPLVSQIIKNL